MMILSSPPRARWLGGWVHVQHLNVGRAVSNSCCSCRPLPSAPLTPQPCHRPCCLAQAVAFGQQRQIEQLKTKLQEKEVQLQRLVRACGP